MRYNKIERVGLYKFCSFIEEELDWIIREQPIVDVGIDALIEEKINGNPTGKFIAVQLKSGEGNFYRKVDKLIYYVSNTHYSYWTDLEFPVVIVLYSQKDKCFYWEQINKRTLVKAKKQWKIEIDKNSRLDKTGIEGLNEIILISKKKKDLKVKTDTTFHEDLIMNFYGKQFYTSIIKIQDAVKEYDLSLNEVTSELNTQPRSIIDKKAIDIFLTKASFLLNVLSIRIDKEVVVFSISLAQFIYSCKRLLGYYFILTNRKIDLIDSTIESIRNYIEGFKTAIKRGEERIHVIRQFPGKHDEIKKAKIIAIESYELALSEFKDSMNLCYELIEGAEKLKKSAL